MSRTKRHSLKATTLKKLDTLRLLRGFDRKAHFEAGGTPADWRGKSWVNTDRKKEASRKACRRRNDPDT